MLSKNKIKLIQSLSRKKYRDENQLFLAEGNKIVEEAIDSSYPIETLICTSTFLSGHPEVHLKVAELIETDEESIRKASLQQNPQDAIAIIRQESASFTLLNPNEELILALDFIQDPGNLGTILRIADWFGIKDIVCSENTVDVYNPKVVQASMGAIFRVQTCYTNLEGFLRDQLHNQVPVYGTFLDGKNIYTETLSKSGILVMGNEGNGISGNVEELISCRLHIPSFSAGKGSESLNVAIATAICCSEFKRR